MSVRTAKVGGSWPMTFCPSPHCMTEAPYGWVWPRSWGLLFPQLPVKGYSFSSGGCRRPAFLIHPALCYRG